MFGKLFVIAPAPPDTGKAYIVAISGCFVKTVIFGIANSFGSFSNSIREDEGMGYPSRTQIAIAGSFATGLGPILGIFSGIAVVKLGSRATCMFASVCCALSMILSSLLANSVVTLVLTYSVFIAFGGYVIAAGTSATSTWFVKRKALGMGINFCGSGLGSLTIPYIAGVLQSKYHWRTCFLVLSSFTGLGMIFSFFVCMRKERENEGEEGDEGEGNEAQDHIEQETTNEVSVDNEAQDHVEPEAPDDVSVDNEPITDWRTAIHKRVFTPKELFFHVVLGKDFIVLFLIFAIFTTGLYAMLFSAVPFALSMGKEGTIYADAPAQPIERAVLVFVAYGAAQIVGGPSLGYLASVHVGDKLVCVCSLGLYSILLLIWITCRELWQHMVMMGLMALCTSGFCSTYSSIVGYTFHGPNLAVVMGFVFSSSVVGGFAGAPMATALTEANNGDYTIAFIVAAAIMLFGTFLVIFGVDCDKVTCFGGNEEDNNEEEEVAQQSHVDGNSEDGGNEPVSS